MALDDIDSKSSSENYFNSPPNDSSYEAQELALGLSQTNDINVEAILVNDKIADGDEQLRKSLFCNNNETAPASTKVSEEVNFEKDNEVPRLIGAAIVFGLITLPFGPLIATVASGSAAYFVSQKEDNLTGDICRGAGDVALAARDKALEINAEQNIVERFRTKTVESLEYLQIENDRHRYAERMRSAIEAAYQWTKEFESRHRLMDRGLKAVSSIGKVILEKNPNVTEEQSLPEAKK